MKSILKIIFLIFFPVLAAAQGGKSYEASLHAALNNAANDTVRLEINRNLGFYHQDSNPDTALVYHEAQLAYAKKLKLKLWEADAYQQIAYCFSSSFQFPEAYENYMQALKIVEDPSSSENGWGYESFSFSKNPEEARRSIIGMIHWELAAFYTSVRYNEKALLHLLKAVEIGESLKNQKILGLSNRDIGAYYLTINKDELAIIYFQKALRDYMHSPYQKNLGAIYGFMGQYYFQKQQYDSALYYYRNSMNVSLNPESHLILGTSKQSIGQIYIVTGQLDSALIYTLEGQKVVDSLNNMPAMSIGFTQLGSIYKVKKEYAVAYDYLEKGKNIGDSLANDYIDKLMQFQNLDFDQKFRLQELEKENQQAKSRNRMFAMLAGLGIILLVALLLYRNNRQKQKANLVLENTLTNLRATQSQLVQSEKMASLGELTAGIAHEIQNPLNFVNNFSEVNQELLAEMREEIEKKNFDEVNLIAKDVEENEEKIIFHGKRADAIVKSMLQHSRSSNNKKEPTDINTLADEYLRLAYHGLRAKDKTFNATMKTEFDKSIERINIIPQDIGRVILNLITNAFYAVNARLNDSFVQEKKSSFANASEDKYEPTVTVITQSKESTVEIKVKDNGSGMPQEVVDKIFQPFFTTKPTGQGTGLGLSMSFDIIKAHGGELKVETKENEGSTFIILLPVIES